MPDRLIDDPDSPRRPQAADPCSGEEGPGQDRTGVVVAVLLLARLVTAADVYKGGRLAAGLPIRIKASEP